MAMPVACASAGSGGFAHSNCMWVRRRHRLLPKRLLLLHCPAESVQDIFFTLADTGNTYETAKAKIMAYFTPHKNTSYNRHMFRKACQNDEDSVAQYVTRLRQLAHLCEF